MKIINCYLKTLKFDMYLFPMIASSHRSPYLPVAARETIEANLLLQINSWVSIPATRKTESASLIGNIEKKYTAISTNCKNSLMKFFTDSTDQHLILNSLPSKALHERFIKIRHYINILYTIYMDSYYKPIVTLLLNWPMELSCLMCSGKRDHNCGGL